MKVTVCQIDPRERQLDRYIDGLSDHLKSADSDFVLLPEMGFSDWLAADKSPDANRWAKAVDDHDGYIKKLGELGAKAVMGTRPIINDCGSRRNEAYIWTKDTDRASGVREKYYLPDEDGYWEHSWYERGPRAFDTTRISEARIGVQICTEMWFFEWARHYAAACVDLLCIPRATPHGSTDKWLAGGQTSAVCSGAYSLSSNLWFPEGYKANCGGLSWVIDPEGNILATTDPENPFMTVDINLEFSKASKSTYPRYVPE